MLFTALSLFSPEVSASLSLSEKLGYIFNTAVVGFLVVFVVLAVIWLILEIFGKIFGAKKKKASAIVLPAPVPAPSESKKKAPSGGEKAAAGKPEKGKTASGSEELVAVLAAAVAAYTASPTSSFRVVSFRKTGKSK